jgi:hypothetical protein
MEFLTKLFTNRRGWAFVAPITVIVLDAAGISADEAAVQANIEKAAMGASALLALWSLVRPK